ncbi:MAG: tetratricopeptide repeat protein [Phycisphaeraceae bacterium]
MKRTLLQAMLLSGLVVWALPGCEAQREAQAQARITDYLDRADGYLEQGLQDSAFAMFGQALLENPRVVDAHIGIGDIYKERGDYDKASVRFELAAAIEPTNFDAHYNLGICKQVLGDLPYAIRSYKRAINLVPDSAEANRDLASAYLQDNRPGLALAFAKRATELDNESFGAWANLGFIYVRGERFVDAIDAFRTASEMASGEDDLEPVLLGLADAHIRLGNYTRAMNTLNTLIATAPSSTAHERLGVCHFKQKKYEEALRSFKAAIALDGNDTAALNGLGVAYMTLYIEGGRDNVYQRDQAIKAWSKSLDLKPNQQAIVSLLTRYGDI